MAIGDFAISDRAISAPEDVVVLVVNGVGRAVLRHRAINSAALELSSAGSACLIDSNPMQATLSHAGAGFVALSHAPINSASLEIRPL